MDKINFSTFFLTILFSLSFIVNLSSQQDCLDITQLPEQLGIPPIVLGCEGLSVLDGIQNQASIQRAIDYAKSQDMCISFPDTTIFLSLDLYNNSVIPHTTQVAHQPGNEQGILPILNFSNFNNEIQFNNVTFKVDAYSINNAIRSLLVETLLADGLICQAPDSAIIDNCSYVEVPCTDDENQYDLNPACIPCPICLQPCDTTITADFLAEKVVEFNKKLKVAVMLIHNKECSQTYSDFSISGIDITSIDGISDQQQDNPPYPNLFDTPFLVSNDCSQYTEEFCEEYLEASTNQTIDSFEYDTILYHPINNSRPWSNNLVGIWADFMDIETGERCEFPDPPAISCNTRKPQAEAFSQFYNITINNLAEGFALVNATNVVCSNLILNNFRDTGFSFLFSTGCYLLHSEVNGSGDGNCNIWASDFCHIIKSKFDGRNKFGQAINLEFSDYCSVECSDVHNVIDGISLKSGSDYNLISGNTIVARRGIFSTNTDDITIDREPNIGNILSLNTITCEETPIGTGTFGNTGVKSGICLINSSGTIVNGNTMYISQWGDGVCLSTWEVTEEDGFHSNTIITNNEFIATETNSISPIIARNKFSCPMIGDNIVISNNDFPANTLNQGFADIKFDGFYLNFGTIIENNNKQLGEGRIVHNGNISLTLDQCLSHDWNCYIIGCQNFSPNSQIISERTTTISTLEEYINIFPNPTSNSLHISSKTSELINCTIFNSIGEVLEIQGNINSTEANFQLVGFTSGVYFIEINYGDKKIIKKFIYLD